jgi:alpha-glucosidase
MEETQQERGLGPSEHDKMQSREDFPLAQPDLSDSIFHDPSELYLDTSPPSQASPFGQRTIWLRCHPSLQLEQAFLVYSPDGEQSEIVGSLSDEGPSGTQGWNCQWWSFQVSPINTRFHYRFCLQIAGKTWWFNAAGLYQHLPSDHWDFKVVLEEEACGWVSQTVFYQIFPDRFASGDPSLKPQEAAWELDGEPIAARQWGEDPKSSQGSREFFGGDLEGIGQHLDHLEKLGVNGIYLNPIFTAPSSHKYDVASYREVDPHLGGNPAFAKLREMTKVRGLKLLLDIVPNHCGSQHPWFQSALQARVSGADTVPSSDFFSFGPEPDDYACWLGHKTLPKLNYHSPALRREMYEGPESVLKSWIRPPYSIDGWRLDVANMLGRQGSTDLNSDILKEMRQAIKLEAKSSYILGENFFDATKMLQGEQLDGAMNYRGFMFPLYHWLLPEDAPFFRKPPQGSSHRISSQALQAQLTEFRACIPWNIAKLQLNLLGSHDTPRLGTACNEDWELVKTAFLCLLTYLGSASIYYGDEIGMLGGRDPDNRRCMDWSQRHWNQNLFEFVRSLISIRKNHRSLQNGSFQAIETENPNWVGWMRSDREERLIVLAARVNSAPLTLQVDSLALADGERLQDLLNPAAVQTVIEGKLLCGNSRQQIWKVTSI